MIVSKIFSLVRSKFTVKHDKVPHRIYGGLVAQARKTELFTDFAIPDTVMGRYDMLGLHVFLLNNRLKSADCENHDGCRVLSQKIFDLFVIDLERGLRDIGFADTSVHKRKKRLVHSYYALIDEFDTAIANGDKSALSTAMASRYFAGAGPDTRTILSNKLARYVLQVAQELGTKSSRVCLNGDISWPQFLKENP